MLFSVALEEAYVCRTRRLMVCVRTKNSLPDEKKWQMRGTNPNYVEDYVDIGYRLCDTFPTWFSRHFKI